MAASVVLIGACNVDILGFVSKQAIFKQSNAGRIQLQAGGGIRNCALALQKLGIDVTLVCGIGEDFFGEFLQKDCQQNQLDTRHCLRSNQCSSSLYLGIMDEHNDSLIGLSDLSIEALIDVAFLKTKHELLSSARMIVLGSGLPYDSLEYILKTYTQCAIFMDGSSCDKTAHIKQLLHYPLWLKVNHIEAQFLAQHDFKDVKDLKIIAHKILALGVSKVIITLSDQGAYYADSTYQQLYPIDASDHVVSSLGAGDNFSAGIVFSFIHNLTIDQMMKVALTCGKSCVESKHTVNPDLSLKTIAHIVGGKR